jgi:hypothetical protein
VVRAHALTEISPPGGGRVPNCPPLAPSGAEDIDSIAPSQSSAPDFLRFWVAFTVTKAKQGSVQPEQIAVAEWNLSRLVLQEAIQLIGL